MGPATGAGGTGNGAAPFSGGPGAVPHTGGEEKDTTGEETSPSDFRAVTAR